MMFILIRQKIVLQFYILQRNLCQKNKYFNAILLFRAKLNLFEVPDLRKGTEKDVEEKKNIGETG